MKEKDTGSIEIRGDASENQQLVEALTARDGRSILPYVELWKFGSRIDSSNASQFAEKLAEAKESPNGGMGVVINFGKDSDAVTFISSPGWWVIIDQYKARRASGKPLFGSAKVVLFNLPENIKESLEIVDRDKEFVIYTRK